MCVCVCFACVFCWVCVAWWWLVLIFKKSMCLKINSENIQVGTCDKSDYTLGWNFVIL